MLMPGANQITIVGRPTRIDEDQSHGSVEGS